MAQTMKAVTLHAFGGPEVLKLEDVPRPMPREGELVIRVRAVGINPIDYKTRRIHLQPHGARYEALAADYARPAELRPRVGG